MISKEHLLENKVSSHEVAYNSGKINEYSNKWKISGEWYLNSKLIKLRLYFNE